MKDWDKTESNLNLEGLMSKVNKKLALSKLLYALEKEKVVTK